MMRRCSTSRCSTRMVKGLHRFTLEKYSLCKGIGYGQPIYSNPFTVGGYQWVLTIFPDGTPYDTTKAEALYLGETSEKYVGLFINRRSEGEGVRILFKMTLLDQSGEGKHRTLSLFDKVPDSGPILMGNRERTGYAHFIAQDRLEKSSYLKDDCLKIECTIGVVLPYETETMNLSVGIRKCNDVGVDFLTLLETGKFSDIIFYVSGKKFRVHKVILSSRSSVFESIIARHSNQQKIIITGVEPRVFKALLHFLYTNMLPEDEKSLACGYAFGPSVSSTFASKLLAAAHDYDVRSLKLICESHIWKSISLNRFAETISLAEMYNASALKHLCFEYAADNYAALMELGSFMYLEKNYQLLLNEIDDYLSKRKWLTKKEPLNTAGWLYSAKEMQDTSPIDLVLHEHIGGINKTVVAHTQLSDKISASILGLFRSFPACIKQIYFFVMGEFEEFKARKFKEFRIDVLGAIDYTGFEDSPDMVAVKDADFSNLDAVFCCLLHGTTQNYFQSCLHISNHLSAMDEQSVSSREAVSYLMFAAVKFAELPESWDPRGVFSEKYETFLDCYVNREYVEKLMLGRPSKDMKLQLLQETAVESGLEWNSKALENKLYEDEPAYEDLLTGVNFATGGSGYDPLTPDLAVVYWEGDEFCGREDGVVTAVANGDSERRARVDRHAELCNEAGVDEIVRATTVNQDDDMFVVYGGGKTYGLWFKMARV
ncbi:hypothetical protein BUALT_Bualt07G0004800 [Buddleja alternifolia]|uniref:BTB/POZ domain-containing protein n=1 Tax=Buddleja alternifolia TaxID=168488 RepID=A0AAV6X899_9LAMI|nr:hypothetical protein BUALT_Bualt07G0004800 [Buddleja alternifolia]